MIFKSMKISRKESWFFVSASCIAEILISFPNFEFEHFSFRQQRYFIGLGFIIYVSCYAIVLINLLYDILCGILN